MKWMKLSSILMAGALLVSLGAGCSSKAAQSGAGSKGQGGRATPVEVQPAAKTTFSQKITLSGRLEANQQVDITPKLTGKISEVLVKVGDHVQAGQPIARLDDQDVRIQLQKSQASLSNAQARYEDAQNPTRPETIQKDENLVADAQAKYDNAQKDLDKKTALFDAGALSQTDLDNSKLALSSAKTTLDNAKQTLQLDKAGPTAASLRALSAQVDQSRADLAASQLSNENIVIKSPIEGVVASVPVSVGSSVSSNTVVATVVDLSSMKVKTAATDSQVALVKQGQEIDVNVASLNFATKGKVESVSPLADSTKSFPVEVTIPNPDLQAKVGMVATLVLGTNPREALVVPRDSVVTQDNKNYVYVVDQDKAKQVEVVVGDSNGDQMEIKSGITPGQQIVTKGQNLLFPNSPVTILGKDKSQDSSGAGEKAKGKSGDQGTDKSANSSEDKSKSQK